ncbi:MAG TPA: hypothetical protein VMM92_07875, partial [Thermoanaerobaculia bacterium]|nr:hypothetical protein [Thermoanaerobaculia bacterium]
LRRQDPRWNPKQEASSEPRPNVEIVAIDEPGQPGKDRLELARVVLELADPDGKPHEVHVYEGYWAPLTEGKINLRDVITFLFQAGRNGIKNGSAPFRKWMFDQYAAFPAPIRTVLYLMIALGMVGALVVLNLTIGLVVATRSPLDSPPKWLSNGLFLDLTTTFNAYLLSLVPFALLLAVGLVLHKKKAPRPLRRGLAWASVPFFFLVMTTTILAGLAVPCLFYGHIVWENNDRNAQIWPQILGHEVKPFDDAFVTWAFRLCVVGLLLFLLLWIYKIVAGVVREIFPASGERQRSWWLTLVYGACFGLVVGLAIYEIHLFVAWIDGMQKELHLAQRPWTILRRGIAWPFLIVVGMFVRQVLVQFVGDVAVYVTPQSLDRFNKLRQEIKDCVGRAARAVYVRREPDGAPYQQVIIVGHSLGSGVVYDVLNRLILEDNLSGPGSPSFLNVAERTPLLLTFGSPLNKFAFLFALEANKTDEAREALAAAQQPLLLENYRYRPARWINLYSYWDIISGNLTFYDPPDTDITTQPKAVCNQKDPDATTFLAAHVEYWENPLLFETLYQQVIGRPGPCVPS